MQQDLAPQASTTSASPAITRLRSHTLEAQVSEASSLRRRAQPPRTFTSIVADAHTQDFEKKRKPGASDSDKVNNLKRDDDGPVGSSDDEEDDDEQDALDELDAEALLRERRMRNMAR